VEGAAGGSAAVVVVGLEKEEMNELRIKGAEGSRREAEEEGENFLLPFSFPFVYILL